MTETNTKNIISEKQLLEELHAQNWSDLWLKLQVHTIVRLKGWYGIKASKAAFQEKSRQIVQDILNLVFVEKTRKWNLDEYSTLENFLYSVIDSHINNSFKTKPREIAVQDEKIFDTGKVDINAQERISATELRNQIMAVLKELKADDDELMVFECLFDGIDKPEDIRKELGISEEEFHNIWRRVNRKRDKLKIKLSSYGY